MDTFSCMTRHSASSWTICFWFAALDRDSRLWDKHENFEEEIDKFDKDMKKCMMMMEKNKKSI